jgi:hypothetical protein
MADRRRYAEQTAGCCEHAGESRSASTCAITKLLNTKKMSTSKLPLRKNAIIKSQYDEYCVAVPKDGSMK